MILLLAGCARHPAVDTPPNHLTLLHTNDIHEHYLPEAADWIEGRPEIGGFVRLDAEVNALRANRGADGLLLLDGGDLRTGTPLGSLVDGGVRGGAMMSFFDALGYDAWVVGNHEFDKGVGALSAFTRRSTMPVLSANVRAADGVSMLLPNQEASHVFVKNGLRIGVIGVTTDALGGLMKKEEFATLTLLPAAAAVQAELTRLDPITDVVVVLSHIGIEADRALAEAVPGVDLIVGGHSHTRMTKAEQVGQVWVVQAGSYNRSLGIVDLVVERDAITQFTYELRDLTPETDPGGASARTRALADGYARSVDELYGEVVGHANGLFTRSYHHESTLGRWIADVLRETAHTDIGLYNGGGLRADIAAGPVSLRSIYECFPFENGVTTFTLRGTELQALILRNIIAENDEQRGFLPISGVHYQWRQRNGAPELVSAEVGGQPLDLARTYSIATNSYVVEQWERHLGVRPQNVEPLGMSDYDAAVAWVRAHPQLTPPSDVRAEKVTDAR